MAALEGTQPTGPRIDGSDFWALNELKDQLSEAGAAGGGVLYTGSVRLPTGEEYAWQMTALTQDLLEDEWKTAAESFAALGHPVRIRLLREILGGRRTAAELAEPDEVGTTGQIYHHLRQLTAMGWLHTTGRGRYEVPSARVVPLLVALATTRP
ncbi:winged helix-turn-helix domain-containing protein [Streptomyces sp. NPDC006265]|uniref:ArsR/SmtB family transcription factor n=1 Tax=Streptomyces sp. NPDC006265 TaxID=3156740 RepID=UPI0033A45A57